MAMSSADILKSTQPGVVNGHLLNGVRVSSVEAQGAWQALADTRSDVSRIEIPADPHERVAFVRRWMEKNQKTLKQGGMAATLVLPLLAQQALADKMVPVNDLQGVSEVIRQPNGSLTLMMNSGQRIELMAADVALANGRVVVDVDALMQQLGNDSGLLVPLSQLPDVQTWELLPDGNALVTMADGSQVVVPRWAVVEQGDLLLISPSDALQQGIAAGEDFGNLLFVPSASFTSAPSGAAAAAGTTGSNSAPVSSFADIPPWLYIGGGAIAVGAAAAGGGGGGGSSPPPEPAPEPEPEPTPEPPVTVSGYVIDGYISGATVTRALDANSVTTNREGFFEGLQGSGILTATGGVDISTGLPFVGELRAPEGATVITPLTTMMVQLAQQFNLNDADAQTAIKTALGLDQRIDLVNTDPLAESSPNADLLIAGVKVSSLLAMAATAGISNEDALSLLAEAFNEADDVDAPLSNQEMADLLGLPTIAGQVTQALDAIDAAGENLNVEAYREGVRNPLRDAQRDAQNPDSSLSDTIETRADLPYLTLQQAVTLSQNNELPSQYLLNPDQPFASGNLGLTVAADRLVLVQQILEGDYDADSAPIALEDIYTWAIRARVEDVLVTGGLERPAVLGATRVMVTNDTIRPDQFADLNTLDNFVLGNTIVPYRLEQALNTSEMPANYTLDPDTLLLKNDLTLREAAELIDATRLLIDRAVNAEEDGLTREMLLDWTVLDSFQNVISASSADPQLNEAGRVSVTESIITPAQFSQLSRLDNFDLGVTDVIYTLENALAVETLPANYVLDLDAPLDAGVVTVSQAIASFADVSRVLQGANNQPPVSLFQWSVSDTASAIIDSIEESAVTGANPVVISDRAITVEEFELLNGLDNFQLGETVVSYTLSQAVNAAVIAENYDISDSSVLNAGSLSVVEAEQLLSSVELILSGAMNAQSLDADQLFNWTVVDSADNILSADNVPHLLRATSVSVSDDLITLSEYESLLGLDSNYIRTGEVVEYTLEEAIRADDRGTLLNGYAISVDSLLDAGEVSVAEAQEAYLQITELVDSAENRDSLGERLPFHWVVVDDATVIIEDLFENHVALADQVFVSNAEISQPEYERLIELENFDLGSTVVRYTLEGAVNTDVALPDSYLLETDTYAPSELSVAQSRSTLERVELVVGSADNADSLNVDELFNWIVQDSASAVLAIEQGAAFMVGADEIRLTDQQITVDQFESLLAIENDNRGYQRGNEQVEYTLGQAFERGPDDVVDNYLINTQPQLVLESLAAEDAIENLSIVRELLGGAENSPDLSSVYSWSILDSYNNIQSRLGASAPDGLQLAESVEVTDETLTAAQYEQLMGRLDNFSLGEEVTVVYADINDALRAQSADILAPDGRFVLNDTATPFVAKLVVEEAANELTNVRAVLEAGRNVESDNETAQRLFDWTVNDTASNIIQAIAQDHIVLADRVQITDAQLTYEQYQSLIGLGNYDYNSDPVEILYTLEEALEIIESEGVEALVKGEEGNSAGYRLADTELSIGVLTAEEVRPIVESAVLALSGANAPVPAVNELLKWSVIDSASALLATQSNNQFPLYLTGAEQVSVNNDILAIADLQRLQRLSNFELEDTPVRFIFTRNLTLGDIENIADSYEIVASRVEIPNFLLTSVPNAETRYQATQAIVDGALNRQAVSVEALQTWSITSAQPDELLAAGAAPWISGADTITLDLGSSASLTPEQYEAFVTLGNVDLENVNVSYSLEEAIAEVNAGGELPGSNEGRPGSYEINAGQPFDAASLVVSEVESLLVTVEELLSGASNAESLDRETLLNWVIEDSVDQVLNAIGSEALSAASSVRVNVDEISFQDFEVLSELPNFDQEGLTVTYPLSALIQRSLDGLSLPENYALQTDQASFFDAGALDARAAERLFETSTLLLEGAVNSDTPLSSLATWVVQDTYANIYTLNVAGNNGVPAEFLIDDAASIVIIDDPLESDDEQDLNITFTVNGYTHQPGAAPGGSVTQLSKTFNVDGQAADGIELITDFRVGSEPGFDQLFIDLTANEFDALRGDEPGFERYDDLTALGEDIAFAVFTTEEFMNGTAGWLDQLGLNSDEVVYLLAGNGDTPDIEDDAQLFRVELTGSDFDTQLLANFENLDLNGFLEENWNTNYSIT
ncbi:calcium-binding protein [Halomonas sp. C22]|uniref:calcium-binding protein n=1 Tax=Halomonas sp. C22 TaxID=2580567 RepID=UPI00119DAA68|nr:calcium-binding protein [Halomonas sp. C22]